MATTTTAAAPAPAVTPTTAGNTITEQQKPAPSALQTLLLSSAIDPSSPHPPHLQNLAAQIMHNLQHQHRWTDLRIHNYSLTQAQEKNLTPLPRPLISGLPPQRLYIHPDEQIALLQRQKDAGGAGLGEVRPEREFVLPSQLRERWSLARFGDVFDAIGVEPPLSVEEENEREEQDEDGEEEEGKKEGNEWRTTKRVLLATVDDDSTIVYYIVHDGIVKPRQN